VRAGVFVVMKAFKVRVFWYTSFVRFLAGNETSGAGGRTYYVREVARAEYSLLFSLSPANPLSSPP